MQLQSFKSLISMALVGIGRIINNASQILIVYSILLLTPTSQYEIGKITQVLSILPL